ncbi:MAG: NUDIX domain-containing protein [Pseudomonadota bacterium]
MGEKKYEVLKVEPCHRGYFELDRWHVRHTLFAGGWGKERALEVFERGHAAAVLPYDPKTDEVVLVEQFRVAAIPTVDPPWLIEIPAGIIDAGEDAETTVRREVVEEAGLELKRLKTITRFLPSPGAVTEAIDVFLGEVDAAGAGGIHGLDDEGEDIRVHVMVADDAIAMADDGRLIASHTVIALLWLARHREAVRAAWA